MSAASLAKMLGCHRDSVGKALHELTRARWLAIRTHKTAEGKRVFDDYHVHAARKFTEAEAATWSESVVLPTRAYGVGTPLPTEEATPCLSDGHPPAYGGGTKEKQPEHLSENQEENHSSTNRDIGTDDFTYCQHCEDSRVNVCCFHFHERQHRDREPDGQTPVPPSCRIA